MGKPRQRMARYETVGGEYLQNRQLRKSAGWGLLWALGVGAVISGDFFGWNFGLTVGGFWGLALATLLMTVMYFCLVFSIAELSAALPHAGGFYSFTRNAFGPLGGFLCGVTDTIEYVITPAVIAVAIGGYLSKLVPDVPVWVWWVASYAVFATVNIRGTEITLKVSLVVTLLAIAVLAVFFMGAVRSGAFRAELLVNIPADEGQAQWLPRGWYGVFAALPYAIWFYLAIEQLPLAAEETHDVVRDMPRALLLGMATLLVLALLTLVLNTGVNGGAEAIGQSKAPLQDGFVAVFGPGALADTLTLVALAGLIASFHNIIYAYGRVLFALSRAGYFPRWISLTGPKRTPYLALILGAGIGLLCTVVIQWSGEESMVGAALLNMAVFGAVLSYILVLLSYIRLRLARPELPRPYRSPLGVTGAAVGTALAVVALLATLSVEAYRPAVWGLMLFLAVAVLYFLFYSRHRLVAQAPEEEAALIAQAEKELAH
jgi:ethanolamine permease